VKGILPLLGVLFVALKLTNYIDWSWWWVLSPFIALGCIGIIACFIAGALILERRK
jgi:hypothetical protein